MEKDKIIWTAEEIHTEDVQGSDNFHKVKFIPVEKVIAVIESEWKKKDKLWKTDEQRCIHGYYILKSIERGLGLRNDVPHIIKIDDLRKEIEKCN
jgi:hypothetical protein